MRFVSRYLTRVLTAGLLACPLLCHCAEKKYTKEEVVLFCSQTCPPCQKVLEYLRQIDRAVTIRNVSESEEHLADLLRIGGKAKVPCLAVDHKAIYESTSIINWLSEHREGLASHKEIMTSPKAKTPQEEKEELAAAPFSTPPVAEPVRVESDKEQIKKIQDKHRAKLDEKIKLEAKEKAKAKEKKKR